jgi:Uma2 family endonuclease
MNIALPVRRLTVDQFLSWAERQPEGKFELVDGVVVMQQAQKWNHSKVKFEVAIVLREAIKKAGAACYVASDGPTVRISRHKAFVPDALVAALPEPRSESLEVADPIIVVEVLSPSTARMDETTKLDGYFRLPSVRHYLIVDPDARTIAHHKRGRGGMPTRRIVRKGALALKPPGIEIALADIFGPVRP